MMVPKEKGSFIKTELFVLLNSITADSKPRWGKMNAQQMLEHLVAFFNVSTEKIKFELVTPPEHLPKYKEFLLSDKPFRENTKAPLTVLGDQPLSTHYSGMEEAKASLAKAVNDFEMYFINDPGKKTLHPVFGPLDFEEWILLHYKHVTHHLRQFGISC